MNVSDMRRFLLWCTVVDYAVLLAWFWLFVFAHDWLWRMQARWYPLSFEQFAVVNYAVMGLLKIGILLFNVAPLVALWIVSGRRCGEPHGTGPAPAP